MDVLERAVLAPSPEEGLSLLLEAWRRRPLPELAAVIEAVGKSVAAKRPRLAGRLLSERDADWFVRQAARDPADVDLLLTSPKELTEQGLGEEIEAKLAKIRRWPSDPRVASAVLEFVRQNVFYADAGLSVLAHIADPRSIDAIRRLVESLRGHDPPAALARTLRALEKRFPDGPPKPTDAERAVLARLSAAIAPTASNEEALLANVYANPKDDAPRLVYADWLLERGDPRGEFIVMSCAVARGAADAASKRKVRELEHAWGRSWLGSLAVAISTSKPIAFRRGFLSRCHVITVRLTPPGEKAFAAVTEAPAWSTLEEVRMAPSGKVSRAPLCAHLERLGIPIVFKA